MASLVVPAESLQGYLAHKTPPLEDPAVGLYLGSYGGPQEGGIFLMREAPLYSAQEGDHGRWQCWYAGPPISVALSRDGQHHQPSEWQHIVFSEFPDFYHRPRTAVHIEGSQIGALIPH